MNIICHQININICPILQSSQSDYDLVTTSCRPDSSISAPPMKVISRSITIFDVENFDSFLPLNPVHSTKLIIAYSVDFYSSIINVTRNFHYRCCVHFAHCLKINIILRRTNVLEAFVKVRTTVYPCDKEI